MQKVNSKLGGRYLSLPLLLFAFFLLGTQPVSGLEEESIPQPGDLKANWWADLSKGSASEVTERLQAFQGHLKSMEEQIPEGNREAISEISKDFGRSVQDFLLLRNNKGTLLQVDPKEKESYSLDDLLAIARSLREKKLLLDQTQDRLEQLEEMEATAQVSLDGVVVNYSSLSPNTLDRFLLGLSLMLRESHSAVLQEQIRLAKETIEGQKLNYQLYRDHLRRARERTQMPAGAVEVLITEAETAQLKAQRLQDEFLPRSLQFSEVPGDDLDPKVLHQLVTRINLAQAKVLWIQARAKVDLSQLQDQNPTPEEIRAALDDVESGQAVLSQLEKDMIKWRRVLQGRQEAVGKVLSKGQAEEDQAWKKVMAYQLEVQEVLSSLQTLEDRAFQTEVLLELVLERSLGRLPWTADYLEKTLLVSSQVLGGVSDGLDYILFRVNGKPVTIAKIIRAIVIVILAYIFSIALQKALSRVAQRKSHVSKAGVYSLNRIAKYVILSLGLVFALGSIGIDFSSLLLIAGALSVGIGFGLQGIVNNFLGGLIVLFDRKLRLGDLVELCSGEKGHITEVNIQNTVIRSLDGHDILVPNMDIISRQLTNWTLRDKLTRVRIPFGVAYETDKEKVRTVVKEAAKKVPETVLGSKKYSSPAVWLVNFGESSLDFELVVWVDLGKTKRRINALRAAYLWEIETVLSENNITIPFPQRDLHIKNPGSFSKEQEQEV